MPRHANYTEWVSTRDETDRTARGSVCELDYENPFDDPDVRQRIAELIVRSVRSEKKSRA
jgi:hypothetical protein